METVTLHPCTHFQAAVRAVVADLPHPLSYDVRLRGCKGRIVCSSKLAWISARSALRRWDVLNVRGYATHGRFELAVGVA